MRSLDLSRVYLPDSFCRDAEGGQEIILQFGAVWLDGKGSLHAQQPGVAFLVSDRELFVCAGNVDRPIVLLKELRASKPAAEKIGQLLA